MVELDPETKARIRAEEEERVRVRTSMVAAGFRRFLGWVGGAIVAVILLGVVLVVQHSVRQSADDAAALHAREVAQTPTAEEPGYLISESSDQTGTLSERIFLTSPATREGLRALLTRLMPADHNGSIWAYATEDEAKGDGAWVAMVHKNTADDLPVVTFDEQRVPGQ